MKEPSGIVRAALERIPIFTDGHGLLVRPLTEVQSLNNSNWLVVRHRSSVEQFVLRIADPIKAASLGISRSDESAALRAAAAAGIAPEVLYYDDSTGCLVTRWLRSQRAWETHDFQDPVRLAQLADLLRRTHAITVLPDAPGAVFRRIRTLAETVRRLQVEPPGRLDEALLKIGDLEERCALAGLPTGLNHHDLWSNNMLDDGTRLMLVDWEFAGSGNGLYDLATVSMEGNLSRAQEAWLLDAYGLNGSSPAALLEEMKGVVRLFEALWALVMHGLEARPAGPGFDYLAHARRMFADVQKAAG